MSDITSAKVAGKIYSDLHKKIKNLRELEKQAHKNSDWQLYNEHCAASNAYKQAAKIVWNATQDLAFDPSMTGLGYDVFIELGLATKYEDHDFAQQDWPEDIRVCTRCNNWESDVKEAQDNDYELPCIVYLERDK